MQTIPASSQTAVPLPEGLPVLNAIPVPAAILSPDAHVMAVNPAWDSLASEGELAAFCHGPRTAAAKLCGCADGHGCHLTETASDGIARVIHGEKNKVSGAAACFASGDQRWFRVDVTALPLTGGRGALVMCGEIDLAAAGVPA
ncbi:MAG: hypothetical protein JNM90_15380 [Burkholderiales bacterium]|nr:hypothetical protein [Burkholderiales bacterium]